MERPNLLLIEDSETDAHFVIRILNKEFKNARYEWISDGQSALDYFDNIEYSKIPDMILLDLKIPKINGLEVLKQLKSHPLISYLPIIVYSSSGDPRDIERAYSYGANSYLVKPNDYKEMKENLGITFKYWIEKNIRPIVSLSTDSSDVR